jgi:hypothetical protein
MSDYEVTLVNDNSKFLFQAIINPLTYFYKSVGDTAQRLDEDDLHNS